MLDPAISAPRRTRRKIRVRRFELAPLAAALAEGAAALAPQCGQREQSSGTKPEQRAH
jgi:hypothetical protein